MLRLSNPLFIFQFIFFLSLFSFSYSDLNLVNKALSVTPLFVYDNIEDKKAEIGKDNKAKSDVYRWINTVTGSSYVGSSTVLKRRIKCYLDTNYLPPPQACGYFFFSLLFFFFFFST
jgi:hypothetical protein